MSYDAVALSLNNETEHDDSARSVSKITSERKNPFLDIDDSDDTLKIIEDEVCVTAERVKIISLYFF